MTYIYLVDGYHPFIDGNPQSAHSKRTGAIAARRKLIDIFIEDYGLKPRPKASSASELRRAQKAARSQGDNDPDAWITKLELKP